MLFNSHLFIFIYLPLVLGIFFWLGAMRPLYAAGWLFAASLFFYGWWNAAYVGLLLASIAFNYSLGAWIARALSGDQNARAKSLLIFALAANLLLLCYYKYANFFLTAAGGDKLGDIILPLGISFFTFTQIAFLVDTYQGKVKEYNFVHYGLFVTYFPHLIAGPVLHHKEMMPQFAQAGTYRWNWENIAVGLTIFFIGLFKKVVLADGIGQYVAPIFNAPAAGITPGFVEAWCGALAYALQLYFDFSGYSDMAIGLSRLFGVTLPLNFHSPYKATSIIEFWRCWHMTLSRFLRDYLYIPLGGNRHGKLRRHLNLMATMLLGGLWHGAGWTFVVWGGLHGVYLVINNAWQGLRIRLGHDLARSTRAGRLAGGLLTFVAVTFAWVFFRAADMKTALLLAQSMLGINGFVLPDFWLPKWGAFGQWLAARGVVFGDTHSLVGGGVINWIWISLLIVWLAPNTQQIMLRFKPALDIPAHTAAPHRLLWQPSLVAAALIAGLGLVAIFNLQQQSEFLYFQF